MPRSVLTSLSCQMRLDQKTIDDDNESLMTLLIRVFLYLSAVHYKYLRIRLVLYFLKPWNPALSSNAIIIVRSWPASLSQQNHPRLVESLLWHNCHSLGLGNNRLPQTNLLCHPRLCHWSGHYLAGHYWHQQCHNSSLEEYDTTTIVIPLTVMSNRFPFKLELWDTASEQCWLTREQTVVVQCSVIIIIVFIADIIITTIVCWSFCDILWHFWHL